MEIKEINKLTDNQILLNIKNLNCNESTMELIKRYENLVYDFIHKYHRKHPYVPLPDLLNDKYIIFAQAIKSYNSEKSKFSTWIALCTRYHCLNTNKHVDKHILMDNTDIDLYNEKQNKFYIHNTTNVENKDYIFNILNQLKDKRISKIFELRYFNNKHKSKNSWNNISNNLSLSITRTISLHNLGCRILLKKFRSSDIMDKV